ncbi:glycosyltransferase [bacterium]|nr:glycosyltransferase [bacterium]
MNISVIIPSYNTWPLIGKTLRSLAKQSFDGEFEVIIADCSTDGSEEKISAEFPKFTLLHREQRDYPGAARNRAIDSASGEIIAMIDADAEADTNWLKQIDENFTNHPEITGFGGAIANANESSKPARIAHFLEFGGYTPEWNRREVRMTPTCNLALKREVFDSARFLTEWFGNEDVTIAKEIESMGGQIIFDPDMLVYHYTRDTWDAIFAHQIRLGRDTGRARFRYNLPGSWLAHTPGVSYLIPLIKYMLLMKRALGSDRKYLSDFLSSTSSVLKALNLFAAGFRVGVKIERGKEVSKLVS